MGKPKNIQYGQQHRTVGEEVTRVVYVRKKDARQAKGILKDGGFLDDRFRMLPATASAIENMNANGDADFDPATDTISALVAIPVCGEFSEEGNCFDGIVGSMTASDDKDNSECTDGSRSASHFSSILVGVGYQTCPYSTKMLGNSRANRQKLRNSNINSTAVSCTTGIMESLCLSRSVILEDVSENCDQNGNISSNSIFDRVLQLDSTVCPGSRRRPLLEVFGDDRTVVVPPDAFEGEEFRSILRDVQRLRVQQRKAKQSPSSNGIGDENDNENSNRQENGQSDDIVNLYVDFWRRLALAHNSPRVVRRGGIDPNSQIRESGHRILWPRPSKSIDSCNNENNTMDGLQSRSWIRVTEQGIKQSFDLTKVMFSRGNISEKIRFGKHLVREGDIVLDLYAGIGYYTLPAVIHGKASKVYACEWNRNAVEALRFNVRDNKIEDKIEIFVGDCRESVKTHGIVGLVDRVSLGLLPSSEGGWRAAIRALKVPSGGWLHVHANVPASEMASWTLWLCHRLEILVQEEHRPDDWWILCNHVERVKSFAPTVFHYVADVFVGSLSSEAAIPIGETFVQQRNQVEMAENNTCRAWMRKSSDLTWIPASKEIVVEPSCALSPDGVLSQDWMR
ncbi:unnamed protein product [Pseudo-nitzschia multistriata]|uniref:SAM-dependent methyltransferase TRM5/TYW2-type domain-containing protein n=1 Tax=Pseudo-nitzschia multistriata TaxID=183589 RepID=A0A448ZA58_9STRA|nr:unnamed protein product [Pseudo-nitzschia multistriata]